MSAKKAKTELFDAQFLTRVEALREFFRGGFGGRQALGGRLTGRPGGEVEFLKHRPYFPGDDLRRCDWKAFQRTGKVYLREFAREEIIGVRAVLDASDSMGEGEPGGFFTARRLALLFMGVLREEEAPLEVTAVSDKGEKRRTAHGKRFGQVISFLASLETSGVCRGVTGVFSPWQRRMPGVTLYISDFYPEAEMLLEGRRPPFIRPGGKERLVFLRVHPDWRLPGGHTTLIDVETRRKQEAVIGRGGRQALLEAEEKVEKTLETYAREMGAVYVSMPAGGDEFDAAMRIFGLFGAEMKRPAGRSRSSVR